MTKILVVDDNNDTVDMVKTLLATQGYDVEIAFNGKKALDLLMEDAKHHTLPDLMILDMFMPEMSGREVCEHVRKNVDLKQLKIIFFTVADFSDKGRDMLQRFNVSDYIVKPFHNDDFLRRIKQVL